MINELIERRSCKKFKEDMIPDDIIDMVISAGLHAPSGMNKQSSIILCIKDKECRDKLEALNSYFASGKYDGKPFYNAPVVLVVLYDKSVGTGIYDASLTMANMLNAASMLSLGSCWIHRAKEEFETEEGKALLESLGVKGDYEGVGHVILGYKDESYTPRDKEIKDCRVFKK